MTTFGVNILNIGLMVGSLVAAIFLPFELFLLSYAILGPLHYLTEISWLHDRNYFMSDKWLAVPIALLTMASIITSGVYGWSAMESWNAETSFGALGLALVFLVTRTFRGRMIGGLILLAAVAVAHYINLEIRSLREVPGVSVGFPRTGYDVFFTIFLTTMIHVFVFTAAFVLFGALKSRSRSGHVSFFVMLACGAACFLIPVHAAPELSEYTRGAYRSTSEVLSWFLAYYTVGAQLTQDGIYQSEIGVMFARFIAFAYTYHYLNWFSKTSIIKWHEVSKLRLAAVVVIWIASLGLYGYEYETGLRWLFLLSMLHVFLEFPLNWHSFAGIGRELLARARPT